MKAQAWLPERTDTDENGRPLPVGTLTTIYVKRLPADLHPILLAIVDFHPADVVPARFPIHFHIEGPDGQPWDVTVNVPTQRGQRWTAASLRGTFEGATKAGRYRVEIRTPADRDPIGLHFDVALEQ